MSTYEQGTVSLGTGDRLVLFTDGITEARSQTDEEFGEDRLVELAVDHRGAARLRCSGATERAVAAFTGGRFQDDATLMVLVSGLSQPVVAIARSLSYSSVSSSDFVTKFVPSSHERPVPSDDRFAAQIRPLRARLAIHDLTRPIGPLDSWPDAESRGRLQFVGSCWWRPSSACSPPLRPTAYRR